MEIKFYIIGGRKRRERDRDAQRAKINVQPLAKTEEKFNKNRTVKRRLTPIIAFSSDIVTCFALSTALATCCWCCKPCYHYRVVVTLDRKIVRHTCQTESQRLTSCARNGSSWTIIAFNLLAISVCKWNTNVIDQFKLLFKIISFFSLFGGDFEKFWKISKCFTIMPSIYFDIFSLFLSLCFSGIISYSRFENTIVQRELNSEVIFGVKICSKGNYVMRDHPLLAKCVFNP